MPGQTFYALGGRVLRNCVAALWMSLLLSSTGCNSSKDETATPSPTIRLENNATLGPHLADGQGNTLYYFSRDLAGTNNCTGGCAAIWPLFYDPSPVLGEGLKAEDFTTITTADGQAQTAYKGWPMYYYAPVNSSGQAVREKPGEVTGENVGGVWFVMKPEYSLLIARVSVTNKTTSQSSLKTFLIDSQGRTLYTFALDQSRPATQSTNCAGGCIATWPVYLETNHTLPSALKSSDFGVITRPDGPNNTPRQQTTYKGLPLYYYTPDGATRNKAEGEGINNLWAVAAP
jgi:predicted lipoprotein with Yx(FWY)xxD motif